jgi:predicted enzyme related to lactoylglutathione lyase
VERVEGIGGFFFRADHLGVTLTPSGLGRVAPFEDPEGNAIQIRRAK